MADKWYHKTLRRNVVDMHVPDWNKKFLSRFDPSKYVEMLVLSRAQSAVVYTHSHAGLCYYPTKVGRMHGGLNGRDVFGELLELLHQAGIYVVAYYSLIYDTWAYRTHPDFRIITAEGRGAGDESRMGVCCPNSPYRNHAIAQIAELCKTYDFDGIRLDMTFWPEVCYCPYCIARYAKEVGGQPPTTVDWCDTKWVEFQRTRERWISEFAGLVTSTVKSIRPKASVEHQIGTVLADWVCAVTWEITEYCDFLQGDLYGGKLHISAVNKLLYNLTKNRPHGFENCSNIRHADHTTLKTPELLRLKAYAAIANGAAFVFIDDIHPDGTMNYLTYERMRDLFDETSVYEEYVGGELCQDVAVYYSTASKFDPAENGRHVTDVVRSRTGLLFPHLDSILQTAQSFIYEHIPFGIVTKRDLSRLSDYKVLVLPDVPMMDEDEIAAVRQFVADGGALYASKSTSLVTSDGVKHDDFLLADVFGTSYVGQTNEDFTYLAPTKAGEHLLPGRNDEYPLSNPDVQMIVKVHNGAEVLATTVLPYTPRSDWERFASIHSDPPGIATGSPAMVLNRYGNGRCIYVTGTIEKYAPDSERRTSSTIREKFTPHSHTFAGIVRFLINGPTAFESDGAKQVEVTVFHQADRKRYIVNLLNYQHELPNIPVEGFPVAVHVGDRKIKRVLHLPNETEMDYEWQDEYVRLAAPRIETFTMLAVEYE